MTEPLRSSGYIGARSASKGEGRHLLALRAQGDKEHAAQASAVHPCSPRKKQKSPDEPGPGEYHHCQHSSHRESRISAMRFPLIGLLLFTITALPARADWKPGQAPLL